MVCLRSMAVVEERDSHRLQGCWRHGPILVIRQGCALPDRCVKCNAPAELPKKPMGFHWHPRVIFFSLFRMMSTRIELAPGLCTQHRQRRDLGLGVGWGGALLSAMLLIIGAALENLELMLIGFLMILFSMAGGVFMSRVLVPLEITKELARFKGCGKAFLDSLPIFPSGSPGA
jgi:hypothetical protein